MTEEEKKSAYEAAKARVAGIAVKTAAVASVLSPAVSNAQAFPESVSDNSPEPIEQTVSASPSDQVVISPEEAQNTPAFGSDEWINAQPASRSDDVKAVLSAQARVAHAQAAEMSEDTLQEQDEELRKIMEQYNRTAIASGSVKCSVGALNDNHLNDKGLSNPVTRLELPDEIQQNPYKAIDRSKVEIEAPGESGGYLGKCSYDNNLISIAGANPAEAASLGNVSNLSGADLSTADLKAGGVFAQYFTLLHENTHKMQNEKVGLMNVSDDDVTRMRKNRLTETTAVATEYLAAANMYLDYKAKGVTTLQDTRIDENGVKTVVEIPLERILEYYPGLKEVVGRDGFDLNNQQDKKAVVAASARYWKEQREEGYDSQLLSSVGASPTLAQQFEILRTDASPIAFDTAADAMLKDVYIGGNHPLMDLTDCRDLLDTLSDEEARNKLAENENVDTAVSLIPREKMQAIDEYLTSLGLTGDAEKADFLKGVYMDILNRAEPCEASERIKDILLADGGTVTYADGLVETRYPDTNIRTIQRGADGKAFVMNADVDFTRGNGGGEFARQADKENGESAQTAVGNKNLNPAVIAAINARSR